MSLFGCDHEFVHLGFEKTGLSVDVDNDALVIHRQERIMCPKCGHTQHGKQTDDVMYNLERADG